eukprot:COSAG02_NODE_1883_length_10535_cov_4.902070_11_plen_156_part_00
MVPSFPSYRHLRRLLRSVTTHQRHRQRHHEKISAAALPLRSRGNLLQVVCTAEACQRQRPIAVAVLCQIHSSSAPTRHAYNLQLHGRCWRPAVLQKCTYAYGGQISRKFYIQTNQQATTYTKGTQLCKIVHNKLTHCSLRHRLQSLCPLSISHLR